MSDAIQEVANEDNSHIEVESPRFPKTDRWLDRYCWDELSVNCCNPFLNPESVGYVLASSMPTAATVIVSLYLTSALINLAKESVDCPTGDDDNIPDCDKLLWGLFNPNSVFVVLSLASSILTAIAMPVVGSIIDHSIYRKDIGICCMISMLLIVLLEIQISSHTFVAVVVFQTLLGMISLVNAVVYSSYLPELTSRQLLLVRHRTYGSILLYGFEISSIIVMIILTVTFIGNDSILAARAGAIIAFLLMAPCTYLCYVRLLRCREASQKVPPGLSIYSAGGYKLLRTLKGIASTNPYLLRYIIAIMLIDGTYSVFSIVAVSYLVVQLKMTGVSWQIVVILLLIVSLLVAPLTLSLSKYAKEYYGDDAYAGKPLLVFAVGYTSVVTLLAAGTLEGENDQYLAYIYGVLWGVGIGLYYCLEKGVYYYMVPLDQSAEFSGIAMFAGKILSWAPLLMFFVLYESIGTMQYGNSLLFVFIHFIQYSFMMYSHINTTLASGLACMALFMLLGTAIISSIDMKVARQQALSATSVKYVADDELAVSRAKANDDADKEDGPVENVVLTEYNDVTIER